MLLSEQYHRPRDDGNHRLQELAPAVRAARPRFGLPSQLAHGVDQALGQPRDALAGALVLQRAVAGEGLVSLGEGELAREDDHANVPQDRAHGDQCK